MRKNTIIIIIFILAVLIIIGYIVTLKIPLTLQAPLQGDTTPPTVQSENQEPPFPSENINQSNPQNIKTFTVEGSEFSFTPKTLSIKTGEKVKITFINTGSAPHTFTIDGIIDTGVVQPGAKSIVEFNGPSQKGSYPIYCSVGQHKAQGMEGSLMVES